MRSNPKPGHWRSKALIALLAAVGALAGGTQVLGPTSAVAMSEQGGPCDNPNLDFWEWVAACVEGGGSAGGGSSSGGQSSGGGLPADDGREEVINVSDKRNCAEPGVICIQLGVTEGFSQPDEERTRLREARGKVEREYVACMRERKKYMLPGQKPLCPVYCPADGTFHSPLDRAGCGIPVIEPKKGKSNQWSLADYMKTMRTCRAIGQRKQYLQNLYDRLKAKYDNYKEIWKAHHYWDDQTLTNTAWYISRCDQVYDET